MWQYRWIRYVYGFTVYGSPRNISVHVVPMKCEKYSSKGEILRRKLVIYQYILADYFLFVAIFVTIPMDTDVYTWFHCVGSRRNISVHVVPMTCEKYS